MKQPKPWYWEKRKAWYVTLNGKQVRLHEKEREANKEFYRLMAADGRLELNGRTRISVADAIEAFLATIGHLRLNTKKTYLKSLGPVAEHFGGRQLESISGDEFLRFVTTYRGRPDARVKSFGDSSRHAVFRHIKVLCKWAKETRLIQDDPVIRIKNPWKIQARDRQMTEEEYKKIATDRRVNVRFKEVIEIIWRTGMRPSEVATMAAHHLDARLPIARFQPAEHKTGTKTGLQREVFFPPELMERMRSYATKRPVGPLLRNRSGNPWTSEQIGVAFWRVKRRLGLEKNLVIYMARHGFITRLIESGVPIARVAKMAGHNNTQTIMTNYYHPDTEKMINDVSSIDDKPGEASSRTSPDA